MTDVVERLSSALADRYRVERELGAGGMATVYLAQDLRHDRPVAIKVLRPELAAVIGAERFVAEIRTTAALQHPHILPLFDSGSAGGFLYYVMPYVEGETLRARLAREKQLSVEEAVRITADVADALDYAHRHGVIHRDIKPENILLRDGRPMVADFGIALAVRAAGASRLTETGVSLGTPHYMSPEQAAGDRDLTPRSDIYSLAAVLYEMLTGDPPFQGATAQAIFAKVLTERPVPVSRSRETVPRSLAAAVHRGLARLPADRFATAGDFAEALVRPASGEALPVPEDERAAPPRATLPWSRTGMLAAGAVLIALAGVAVWGWRRVPDGGRALWIPVAFAPGERVVSRPGPSVAISPDGSRIAYVGPGAPDAAIWLWSLQDDRREPLPGTAGGINPAFSPDGRSLVFTSATTGALATVSLAGGPPHKIADSASYFGDAWGPDGYIYYTTPKGGWGISRVPATGGTPEVVAVADTAHGELDYRWPTVLPNGRGLVFTAWRGNIDRAEIAVLDLKARRVRGLFPGAFARYAASGHLVYAGSDHALSAVAFDEDALAVRGNGVPLIASVGVKHGTAADVAVSANGTLAYMVGSAPVEALVWVTRDGHETPVDGRLREAFSSLRLSPDGRRVAVSYPTSATENLWTYDLASGARTRLTFDGRLNRRAEWSADGRWIVYVSDRDGSFTLWRIPAAGGAAPERVLPSGDRDEAQDASASPDGRWLVYRRGPGHSVSLELMALAVGTDTLAHPFGGGSGAGTAPRVSPDGKWVAYVSSESGRNEVYVRARTAAGGRWQVSLDGGTEPVWSRTGGELFYRSADAHLIATSVATGPSFAVRGRRALFSTEAYATDYNRALYDVSPDGRRFLMVKVLSGTAVPPDLGGSEDQLMLVLNWFGALKQAVAAEK